MSNIQSLPARRISKPGLCYLLTIPSQPVGDTPLKRALLNGCTKRFGAACRRQRLSSDCDENDSGPKTRLDRKRNCAKTKMPKTKPGRNGTSCSFGAENENEIRSVSIVKSIVVHDI